MATRDFNASWADIYNASGGWSLAHHNHPIRTGGGSGTNWQTLIRIPDAVKTAIRESSTPAQLHMRIYFTSSANEIDIGHHRERNRRSVGARGIPWYAYNETWRSISNGWNSYQMSNWFMPQFLSGNVQGIVLYSANGRFNNTATGVGQTNSVRFRVTGTWNTAPSTPSNVRIDKNQADVSQTVRWNASTDAEGDSLRYDVQYHNGLSWRTVSSKQTGTTYTMNLANERYSNIARFRVRAYDGELYSGWASTSQFGVEHVPPSFSASQISYQDINTTTVGISGNNQNIIQNASIVRASVDSNASANDGKTIRRYIYSLGGQERTRSTRGTVDFNPLDAENNLILRITAEDNYGLRTTVSKTVNMIPYQLPEVQYQAQRVGSIADETVLEVSGSISSLDGKNSLQTTRYRYRQTGGNYTTWRTLNRSVSGNNFTASNVTLNLSNDSEWEIQIQITDRISTRNIYADVGRGSPIMFIDEENDRLGIGKYPERGTLDVDGDAYFEGSVDMVGRMRADRIELDSNVNAGTPAIWVKGRAQDHAIRTRGIDGASADGSLGDLHLNFNSDGAVKIGSDETEIVESGSNSEGDWIKFYDGTQICYGASPSRTTEWWWAYPKAFIDSPKVVAMSVADSYVWQDTKSDTRIVVKQSTSRWVQAIAIGRWK